VKLAQHPIDSRDVFLYHKTSRRAVYSAALAHARAALQDCDEVVLWNERGEITESCTANVVIDLDGQLFTPPVECGLLAGTLRGELLAQAQLVERVISREMLQAADRLYLINSVRKWMDARLII
jgi:para-aminobenzoate synthetase/4-amino-4-deoxychorismate lyase